MQYQHSVECLAYQEKLRLAHDKYVSEWPNYCQKCGGVGGEYYYGSYDEPPHYSDCECIENDKCPRCGHSYAFTDDNDEFLPECQFCGFVQGLTVGDPTFDADMCICYEIENDV